MNDRCAPGDPDVLGRIRICQIINFKKKPRQRSAFIKKGQEVTNSRALKDEFKKAFYPGLYENEAA